MFSFTHNEKMQIKTTLRYYFPSIMLAKIQKLTIKLRWQGCGGKQAFSYIAFSLGMQNAIIHKERNLPISNKLYLHLHFDQPVSLLGINSEDTTPIIQKHTFVQGYSLQHFLQLQNIGNYLHIQT